MTSKKILAVCGLLVATTLLWFSAQQGRKAEVRTHGYAAFQQEIVSGNVQSVSVSAGSEARVALKSGATFTVALPPDDPNIYDLLNVHNVTVEIEASTSPAWLSAAITLAPVLLVIPFSLLLLGFLLGVGFYWGVRWSRRFTTGSTTGGL